MRFINWWYRGPRIGEHTFFCALGAFIAMIPTALHVTLVLETEHVLPPSAGTLVVQVTFLMAAATIPPPFIRWLKEKVEGPPAK